MNNGKKYTAQELKYVLIASLLMILSIVLGTYFQEHPGSFFLFNCQYTTVPPILTIGFCGVLYALKKALENVEEEHTYIRLCIRMSSVIFLVAVICQIFLLFSNLIKLLR